MWKKIVLLIIILILPFILGYVVHMQLPVFKPYKAIDNWLEQRNNEYVDILVNSFNETYRLYIGDYQRASDTKKLIELVEANNAADGEDRYIALTGIKSTDDIEKNKSYNVIASKDDVGYINEIKIVDPTQVIEEKIKEAKEAKEAKETESVSNEENVEVAPSVNENVTPTVNEETVPVVNTNEEKKEEVISQEEQVIATPPIAETEPVSEQPNTAQETVAPVNEEPVNTPAPVTPEVVEPTTPSVTETMNVATNPYSSLTSYNPNTSNTKATESNSQFERYFGTSMSSSYVKELLLLVGVHNNKNTNNSIKLDGIMSKSSVNDWSSYNISGFYNKEGYLSIIKIEDAGSMSY